MYGEQDAMWWYVRLAVLLCFLAGILYANIMDNERLGAFGIWNGYFLEKFKYTRIQSQELFYYVMELRIPVMLLLLLFLFTSWGTLAGGLFLAWQSFAAGFMFAASVVVYGVKGILLVGTAAFPHYLLYILLYIAYLYIASIWKKKSQAVSGEGRMRLRDYTLGLIVCICIMILYITGIFLESYINPYFLKNILKFF